MRLSVDVQCLATAFLCLSPVLAYSSPPYGPPSWGSWPASYGGPPGNRPTSASSCGYPGGGPTATIDAGVVIGTQTTLPTATAPVNKFLGVPFAKSPPERFSPPEKAAPFRAPINATGFAPACIQQFVYPAVTQYFTKLIFNAPLGPTPLLESEDCLYLNVFAPSSPAPADGRAVLFWLYGGALQFGDAGQNAYDGSFLAGYEDVIVVTTNYRTNVFGFASTPELPIDQRNLGFLDQRMALDWVQTNIAAFGGSPDKVTIFGESAGAFSVDVLLTSYNATSTPPFRGAILESGQYSFRPSPLIDSTPAWYNLSAQLGCPGQYDSNLTCLRAANASLIKSTIEQSILVFSPTPDNVTLYSNIAQRRLDGQVAHVPALAGSNAQEGRIFEYAQNNVTTVLTGLFGINNPDLISNVEEAYAGIGSQYDEASQIFTEIEFQCPQAFWSNATAANGIPNWRYYYNASFHNIQPLGGLGVYHSSEIPLVFGTYLPSNATTQEVALSTAMMGMWAKFAKNPAGGPGWNPIGTGAVSTVLVGAGADEVGGLYADLNGTMQQGGFDLGVLGNRGDAQGSGVTVIDQAEVDFRCQVFKELYEATGGATIP